MVRLSRDLSSKDVCVRGRVWGRAHTLPQTATAAGADGPYSLCFLHCLSHACLLIEKMIQRGCLNACVGKRLPVCAGCALIRLTEAEPNPKPAVFTAELAGCVKEDSWPLYLPPFHLALPLGLGLHWFSWTSSTSWAVEFKAQAFGEKVADGVKIHVRFSGLQ